MSLGDGDWVEGPPQWWWKYVFPTRGRFWAAMLTAKIHDAEDPIPDPWLQRVTADILEGLAILHAAATVGDVAASARLKEEAVQKINRAVRVIGATGNGR